MEPQLNDEVLNKSGLEKTKFELENEISRAQVVLNDLPQSAGFRIIFEDLKKQIDQINDNWHRIDYKDEKTLQEMRVTKLALEHLVNIVQVYQSKLTKYQEILDKVNNTANAVVSKDWDNE